MDKNYSISIQGSKLFGRKRGLVEVVKGRIVKISQDDSQILTLVKIEKLNHELIEVEYPAVMPDSLPGIHQWAEVEYERETIRES